MSCDLDRYFSELASRLPAASCADDPEEGSVLLNATNLPVPPAEIETDRIRVVCGAVHFDHFRIPNLNFSAEKTTFRQLGLLILAALFHPPDTEIAIRLTRPESGVRRFSLRHVFCADADLSCGFHMQPRLLRWCPEAFDGYPKVPVHPLTEELRDSFLKFGFEDERGVEGFSDGDFRKLRSAHAEGPHKAWADLAEVLLDLSLEDTSSAEFQLEWPDPFGLGGVAAGGAYVRLNLPGSSAYYADSAH